MKLLGRHAVLDTAVADRMRQAVGFRNVLVHEYVAVDDDIVIGHLSDLSDLDAFAKQVVAYLDQESR